jgi:hypothetical protein
MLLVSPSALATASMPTPATAEMVFASQLGFFIHCSKRRLVSRRLITSLGEIVARRPPFMTDLRPMTSSAASGADFNAEPVLCWRWSYSNSHRTSSTTATPAHTPVWPALGVGLAVRKGDESPPSSPRWKTRTAPAASARPPQHLHDQERKLQRLLCINLGSHTVSYRDPSSSWEIICARRGTR